MIIYNFTDASTTTASAAHPIFSSSMLVYVWAYSIDSRTSILAVVVLLGCLVVLLRLGLALYGLHRLTKNDISDVGLLVAG